MKTKSLQIMKISGRISVILMLGAFLLFQASCQKEDIVPSKGIIAQQAINDNLKKPVPLPTIYIDHMGMRSNLPQYSVTVYANGNVVFYGRKNTAITGELSFSVTDGTIRELRNMYQQSGLFDDNERSNSALQKSSPNQSTIISDMPFVLTSFSYFGDGVVVTLRDVSDSNLTALIQLRTITEKVLQINKYVYGK